jgi:hypothetical protein
MYRLAGIGLALLLAAAALAAEAPYAAIDRHARAATPEVEKSLAALAGYLVKPCRNERDKVRAIYRWITERIGYDVETFRAGKPRLRSAAQVLAGRQAVCEGYATLFADLGKRAGLEVVKVRGHAKGVGYVPGKKGWGISHTWIAVKLEGKWHLVDPTWGAGAVDGTKFVKRFRDFFFLTPPEQLIFTHLPDERKWQLLPAPLSREEFASTLRIDPQLFDLGVSAPALRRTLRDKGFRDLVKTYDVPGAHLSKTQVPLDRYLRAGSTCRFQVGAGDFTGMVVVNEGKYTFFKRTGDVFRATVTARKGILKVAARRSTDAEGVYATLFEYQVE